MGASTLLSQPQARHRRRAFDLRRFSLIMVIVAFLTAIIVLVGQVQNDPMTIAVSFLATTLAVATPLTLGALGGIFCERAGVVNIAIEGLMLASAFFGFWGAIFARTAGLPVEMSLLIGVLVAVLTSTLLSLLHAVLCVSLKLDQVISGIVINTLAIGLTGYLQQQITLRGTYPSGAGLLPTLHIPLLADLPIVGRLFQQQPIAITAIILVFVAHFVLFRTVWGLRTRAVGEHPRAADTMGIRVERMRYLNVLIGGVITGLAGAYFTLESVPNFQPLMTNGRGFISLAAVIFGNWTPFGAWAATLLFGAAQAFQVNLQFYSDTIPAGLGFLKASQIVGMVPYLLTMIALSGIMGRTTPPAAAGQPYRK